MRQRCDVDLAMHVLHSALLDQIDGRLCNGAARQRMLWDLLCWVFDEHSEAIFRDCPKLGSVSAAWQPHSLWTAWIGSS